MSIKKRLIFIGLSSLICAFACITSGCDDTKITIDVKKTTTIEATIEFEVKRMDSTSTVHQPRGSNAGVAKP